MEVALKTLSGEEGLREGGNCCRRQPSCPSSDTPMWSNSTELSVMTNRCTVRVCVCVSVMHHHVLCVAADASTGTAGERGSPSVTPYHETRVSV